MSKSNVLEISHTQLPVQDLKRSSDFYVNILGFRTKIAWSDQDQEGRKFLKFYDPDGNMIVAHEEPKRNT